MAGIAKKGKAHQIYFYLFGVRRYIYLPKNFPKRDVQRLKTEVEQLKFYREYEMPLPPDLEAFVNNLAPKLRRKLEATGLLGEPIPRTLGELTGAFMVHKETDSSLSDTTHRSIRFALGRLIRYFGEEREALTLSTEEIEAWKKWLTEEEGRAESSVAIYLTTGNSVFIWGIDKGYLKSNPFKGVKRGSMVTEKKRHVTMDEYRRLLEVCPNQAWRTLLALCRIGGLRSPSETFLVKWADVDWENDTLIVHSPKTQNKGKGSRVIPLFPELRVELEASWELAEEGEEQVLAGLSSPRNARNQMPKLMERAGLEPWERPFHNLRGSRDDELFSAFPDHVASEWMGHTVDVARKHYLKVTQDQIKEAVNFTTGGRERKTTTKLTTNNG